MFCADILAYNIQLEVDFYTQTPGLGYRRRVLEEKLYDEFSLT